MRFTQATLFILFATLVLGGRALSGAPGVPDGIARETETHYAGSSRTLPIAAMPSTPGDAELIRLGAQRQVRTDHRFDGPDLAVPGGQPACDARVRIRSIDRTGCEFLPELTHAVLGFLSSSTTACPPPSRR